MVADSLEEAHFVGALGFDAEAAMIKGHQAHNVGRLGSKEVAIVNQSVVCILQSRVGGCVFRGVGVVGRGVLTGFNGWLQCLPVPSLGKPIPLSRLCRCLQPVDLRLGEGPRCW